MKSDSVKDNNKASLAEKLQSDDIQTARAAVARVSKFVLNSFG